MTDVPSAEPSGGELRGGPRPSYDELAEVAVTATSQLDAVVVELAALRARVLELEAENEQLRRVAGRSSRNWGQPSSKDSIAEKARAKAEKKARAASQRQRDSSRRRGGQKGHAGSGLPVAPPGEREESQVEPPTQCRSCHGPLAPGQVISRTFGQVWDIPAVELVKQHWWLPQSRCACGTVTTASVPFVHPGTVCYGPNVNAAAILLSSEGNVPAERTAMLMSTLMSTLLGAPVSAGFVIGASRRLAARLEQAGFDAAMRQALQAEEVLQGDETPVNLLAKNTGADGSQVPGAPHAVVVRSIDPRLIWLTGTDSRSKTALAELGVFGEHGFSGLFVRDDYAGWHQFDATLAGVGQCGAH